jgi:large subunit ribosomal protein L35
VLRPTLERAAHAGGRALRALPCRCRSLGALLEQESQMPKIKTKSGAKKRFKITGTGKVLFAQSGKRHGMIKRTTKQIREHRGTKLMFKTDGDRIKKYWLPNG